MPRDSDVRAFKSTTALFAEIFCFLCMGGLGLLTYWIFDGLLNGRMLGHVFLAVVLMIFSAMLAFWFYLGFRTFGNMRRRVIDAKFEATLLRYWKAKYSYRWPSEVNDSDCGFWYTHAHFRGSFKKENADSEYEKWRAGIDPRDLRQFRKESAHEPIADSSGFVDADAINILERAIPRYSTLITGYVQSAPPLRRKGKVAALLKMMPGVTSVSQSGISDDQFEIAVKAYCFLKNGTSFTAKRLAYQFEDLPGNTSLALEYLISDLAEREGFSGIVRRTDEFGSYVYYMPRVLLSYDTPARPLPGHLVDMNAFERARAVYCLDEWFCYELGMMSYMLWGTVPVRKYDWDFNENYEADRRFMKNYASILSFARKKILRAVTILGIHVTTNLDFEPMRNLGGTSPLESYRDDLVRAYGELQHSIGMYDYQRTVKAILDSDDTWFFGKRYSDEDYRYKDNFANKEFRFRKIKAHERFEMRIRSALGIINALEPLLTEKTEKVLKTDIALNLSDRSVAAAGNLLTGLRALANRVKLDTAEVARLRLYAMECALSVPLEESSSSQELDGDAYFRIYGRLLVAG